jgi:hypothetical protein
LFVGSEIYLDAFSELTTERQTGFVTGPIPRSAIVAYAKEYDFSEEEKEDLLYIIRYADRAHLKSLAAKDE